MSTATDPRHGAAGPTAPGTALQQAVAQARRWYWQRISAMVLALCVLVHLGVMVYAVRGGLTAAEILGRTQGNWTFGAFYAIFVVACAAHVPVGVANIARFAPQLTHLPRYITPSERGTGFAEMVQALLAAR